jgi:hypothetical protein
VRDRSHLKPSSHLAIVAVDAEVLSNLSLSQVKEEPGLPELLPSQRARRYRAERPASRKTSRAPKDFRMVGADP